MHTLTLDDPRWASLQGGHRVPYDASRPLRDLSAGTDSEAVWEELWNGLHHQGDVGEASYAAIPALVEICVRRQLADWNLFALVSTIETCRDNDDNPRLPAWIASEYAQAWAGLFAFGLEALRHTNDEPLVRSVLGVIAQYKGLKHLGRVLTELDASELEEIYEQLFQE